MHILFLILKHDHKKMNIEYGMSYLYVNCVSRIKQIIQHLSGGIILVLRAGVGTLKLQKYAHFIGQAFPINPRRKRALFIRRFEQNTG